MSDPVTNAEVEDVLSSIRRLVSEDKRPMQAQPEAPKPPENDRLVLTPSLRIAEEAGAEAAPAEVEAEPEPTPELSDFMDVSEEVTFEEAHGDDEMAIPAGIEQPARVEGEEREAVEETALAPEEDYSADPYNFDDDDDDFAGDDDDVADEDVIGGGTDAAPEDIVPEAADKIAKDDAAETEEPLPPESRIDLPPAIFAHRQRLDLQQAERDLAAETISQDADYDVAATGNDISDEAGKATALSAKIEALETAIGKISDTWEPDGKGTDDYSGTDAEAMTWEEDVQRDATGAPLSVEDDTQSGKDTEAAGDVVSDLVGGEPEAEFKEKAELAAAIAPVLDSHTLDDTDDTQILDEEALRDMVSEIVRAELQGALGERITRNVRKLVRREIHRALTAQDLE